MVASDIADRVVLLTGETSGIGRIAARELAERGATVAVVGRDRSRGASLTAESATLRGEIRFHRADLATQSAVRSLASLIDPTGHASIPSTTIST